MISMLSEFSGQKNNFEFLQDQTDSCYSKHFKPKKVRLNNF